MSLERVSIFGFKFISASEIKQVVAEIMSNSNESCQPQYEFLITPNAYQLVHYNDLLNIGLKHFYAQSLYILPDGMPIVWVSRLLKKKIKNRLTGSDLFPELWGAIKMAGSPATFILPNESMRAPFQDEYYLCNCFVPLIFNKNDEEYIDFFSEKTAEGIIANKSIFIFLGLGFPKQEILAKRLSEKLRKKGYFAPVLFLLLGASFEFYFGMKKRAPVLLQKTGMEWLYRFAKEPRRLWKRYTVDNFRFLILVIKEFRRKKD